MIRPRPEAAIADDWAGTQADGSVSGEADYEFRTAIARRKVAMGDWAGTQADGSVVEQLTTNLGVRVRISSGAPSMSIWSIQILTYEARDRRG
jgi:hypothetical protein